MLDFILIISTISFLVGLVALFKGNIKRLNIRNRKVAAIVLILSLIVSMVTVTGLDDSNEDETVEADSEETINNAQTEVDEAEQKRVEEKQAKQAAEEEKKAKQVAAEEKRLKEEKKQKAKENKENNKLTPLKAHFIDVGQADASLIEYSDGKTDYRILIDSGDWNSSAAVNYLKQLSITDIDLVVGTHPHGDHIGQMDTIINDFNVGEVWMSGDIATSQVFERVLDAISSNDVDYYEPRTGEEFEIGNLHIEVIHPSSLNGDLNNGSIVLKLTYGSVNFLYTGDAEKEAEELMVNREGNLQANILKVGHHGSSTSSTQSFLNLVKPEVAIISVGENNSYGHPDANVISRLQAMKTEVYATKDNGTVIVETDGESYEVTTNKDGNVTPSSSSNKSKKSATKKKSQTKKESKQTTTNNCVDLNTASIDEIQEIMHIGPERAKNLIDLRPFKVVDDLTKINGIGPARIADIKSEGKACVED